MSHIQRFFQLGNQWCVVHVPERPNGFGVLVIGDQNHFVDEHTSFWIQNNGRSIMVESLLREGYTLFYSNLYGRNWGSSEAVSLARRLYHVILKKEILNNRIHILAEGMGALIALQLMEEMGDNIRSVAMMNPCLDLRKHVLQEKEHKFFYKRIIKEIATAYHYDVTKLEKDVNECIPTINYDTNVPVKIWQTTTNVLYDPKLHTKYYEEIRKQTANPIKVAYQLAEKRFSVSQPIFRFYKEYEKVL